MDFGNDGFRIGRSFIPPIPGKANLTQSQSICTNGQEVLNLTPQLVYHDHANWLEPGILNRVNQVTQSDWSDSANMPRNFRMEAPKQPLPGSYSYFNNWQAGEGSNSHVYGDISRGFDTWQAAEALSSLYDVNDKFPVNDNDSLTQLAFRSLLTHGNAGSNAVGQTDYFAPGSSFTPQVGGSDSTISFGNLSVPDIVRDGSTVRSRPLFDLNSPAEIVSDIASYNENISFQFAPITPQKTNVAEEQRQESSMLYAANYAHEKTINEDTVKELEIKKQRSHVVTGQFRKTVPAKLQENHKPDKGGTEDAEYIKTPKQIPRRKKHRPKVIIEGQSKTTPKPRGRKSSVPEENTGFKRKYVRRNRTNNPDNSPLEREISEIYSTGDTPPTKENVSIKRTYSRRKAINTPETSKNEESIVTEVNTTPYTRSSCRRSLNFEPERQVRGESSSFSQVMNRDTDQSTVHSQHGAEIMANFFPDMRVAYELTQSANQVLQDYLSMPDSRSCSSKLTPAKGKCQVVFSDVTLDKEVTAVQVTANPGDRCSLESARDSIYRSTHLTPDIQSRISKRPRTGVADEAEIRNLTGSYHNFTQRYLSMFSYNSDKNDYTPGMLFPTIYKKKRTAKVYHEESVSLNSTVSASSSRVRGEEFTSVHSYPSLFYSKINQGSSTSPFQVTNLLNSHSENDDAMHKRICLEDRLTVGPIGVIKKKRSNLPTRVRNVASLLVFKGVKLSLGRASKSFKVPQVREQFKSMKSLVVYTPTTLRTKKRSDRSLLVPSSMQNIPTHQTFAGQRLALTWKSMSPVDLIIEQLMQLSLNAVHDRQQHDQSLVPFQMGGALVTFEGIDPVKTKLPRPRVDLDAETTRVWKLLLENINSEGVNGTTQEKEKYWEEERRVFKGRADSFIARMHLIQGDRRFTPWKGSVVDSAIGVFLTQNVSDHLSSSAFMSVASRFPVVNSVESSRNSSCDNIPTENIGCQQQDMSNNDALKSCEAEVNKSTSLISNGRDVDDTSSSQASTYSSQNSADSPTSLRERTESNSLNNSEEGPVLGIEQNNLTSFSSFDRFLQMAGTVMHDCCKDSNCRKEIDENQKVRPEIPQNVTDVTDNGSIFNGPRKYGHKEVNSKIAREDPNAPKAIRKTPKVPKSKGKIRKEKKNAVNWDGLRKEAQKNGKRERTANTMDSVDWDAVRCADVKEIADTIKERGMNNMLAERIKEFLNRLVRDHESIDLEWLRDVEPDKAKEYLMSFRGLGLKSAECVRLLTLHHVAFPVDTNVGRIAVRLGWVPLQPLPESLQLHLLEMYPVLETVQKYLWPRLCKLDQRTLYELHYQMITFGKVFCTKSKPNCNSCPMRGECRHFASAFASARLALPAPEEKRMVIAPENVETGQNSMNRTNAFFLPPPRSMSEERNFITTVENPVGVLDITSFRADGTEASGSQPIVEEPTTPEPVIELPTTPEPEYNELDIEDAFCEDPDEIPTINFQLEQFTQNLQNFMEQNSELLEGDLSKALVALTPEAASIPVPKLKNISRLRTEHLVYELPDSHQLLEGMDKREPDDPSPYLLAIWTPGETVDSTKLPEIRCNSQDTAKLCADETCLSCNSVREQHSQTVRGTILIPCRTAMRGSFPLNGTYFQVNEVFSDHESSREPIDVPRQWLWNLPRRTVYFGTSIPTIFKGLTTAEIQYCFWRGLVCVRGFDRKTRAPRPLIARLHFPVSKLEKENGKGKGKADE